MSKIKALVFDVGGTVFDWRTGIANALVHPGVNEASAISAFLKEVLGLIYCRGIYAQLY